MQSTIRFITLHPHRLPRALLHFGSLSSQLEHRSWIRICNERVLRQPQRALNLPSRSSGDKDNEKTESHFFRDWRYEVATNVRGQVKSQIKYERRLEAHVRQKEKALRSSTHVVVTAMVSNFCLFSGKLFAAITSGSSSMFAEAIHSIADFFNECLLFWGIQRASRPPDRKHPYGFSRERYAWSLVSGVGIFFLGCGVSCYHGVYGLYHGGEVKDLTAAFYVLLASFVFEGGTMVVALRQVTRSARQAGLSVTEYIKSGPDPAAIQILVEDCAAVMGCFIASGSLLLSHHTQNPLFDHIGSIGIGCLLGGVASFLIQRNIAFLVEKSIPEPRCELAIQALVSDEVVSSVQDVKTTYIGPDKARFKAEVLFDGERVTDRMHERERMDMKAEFAKIKGIQTDVEFQAYLRDHGGKVVDSLADEVDRLEAKIQEKVPEVKHCDIEIL